MRHKHETLMEKEKNGRCVGCDENKTESALLMKSHL